MAEPTPMCIPCDRADRSAAAALATVALHHGLPIEPDRIAPFLGLEQVKELGDLVVASRLLGFDSVPLEGGYDELPEVERPNIVAFAEDGVTRFAVLYEIDPGGALVADPLRGGVRRIERGDFVALWTGDCLRLVPASLEETRHRLAARKSILGPPRLKKALFASIAALLFALAATDTPPVRAAAELFLALAAASSLWLALFSKSCTQCRRAHQQAGLLPLERIGIAAYGATLVASRFSSAALPISCALSFAVGAHAVLVVILVKEKLRCPPCLIIASSALAAAILFATLADWGPLSAATAAVSLALGSGSLALALPRSRRLAAAARLEASRRAAEQWLLQHPRGESDPLRLIVWKRAACPGCQFYAAIFKPALQDDFGDAIAIEEIDAGHRPIPTPLILVDGTIQVLFAGLPGTDDDYGLLRGAIECAQDPAFARLNPLRGLYLVALGD